MDESVEDQTPGSGAPGTPELRQDGTPVRSSYSGASSSERGQACACLLEAACAAWQPGRSEEREAVDGCISAIELDGDEGTIEHARAEVRLALLYCADGRVTEAEALRARVDAVLAVHADLSLSAHAARLRSWLAHSRGELVTMIVAAAEAARIATEIGAMSLAAASHLDVGFGYRRLGRYVDAKRTLLAAVRVARRHGLKTTHAWALAELGIAVARDGADARGAFLLDCAITSFLALGDRPAAAATRLKAAQVALDMGMLEACEMQTARAIDLLDAEDTQLRSRALAFEAAILVRRGQRDVACDWARLAVANLDSGFLAADGEATVRLVYAEVLHAAGREGDARRALKSAHDRLLEDAGRIMNLELAHSFLADVPEHARTLELADRWSA